MSIFQFRRLRIKKFKSQKISQCDLISLQVSSSFVYTADLILTLLINRQQYLPALLAIFKTFTINKQKKYWADTKGNLIQKI